MASEILCIQCGGLGDLVVTLPALRAVRGANPGARVTLLSDRKAALWEELLCANGAFDELWLLGESRMSRREFESPEYAVLRRAMRERGFDLAIDFEIRGDTAALVRASGARIRVGRHSLGYGAVFGFAYNRRVDETASDDGEPPTDWRHTHESHRMARLARAAGAQLPRERFRMEVPERARAFAEGFRRENGLESQGYAIVQIAGSLAKKQWPLDRYASIARRLGRERGLRAVWLAAPFDRDATARGVEMAGDESVLGVTESICEAAAVISEAALWFGPDTGPLHIAHALGVRAVGLFGPARPRQWGPRGPADFSLFHELPCRDDCPWDACRFPEPLCMTRLSEEFAWAAIFDSLGSEPGGEDLPSPRFLAVHGG